MEPMRFTLPEISAALRDLGYRGKEYLGEGFSYVESATGGKTFHLFCYGNESTALSGMEEEASLIRLACKWVVTDKYDESKLHLLCNWFNSVHPFSKAYVQQDSDDTLTVIEADVYVLDGMTQAAFKNQLSLFIAQLELLSKQLPRCLTIPKSQLVETHNRAVTLLHSDGGVDQINEAIRLYRQNAHHGFAGSQNNFGDLFEDGNVVSKDLLVAMYWYARASERGEPTSYYSIASLLASSTENPDALILAAQYAILASKLLPEGKNRASAIQLQQSLQDTLPSDWYKYAVALSEAYQPIHDEPSKMGDTPGLSAVSATESGLLN